MKEEQHQIFKGAIDFGPLAKKGQAIKKARRAQFIWKSLAAASVQPF